jgi:hypothetical protein
MDPARTCDRKYGSVPSEGASHSLWWCLLPAYIMDGYMAYEIFQGSFTAERFNTFGLALSRKDTCHQKTLRKALYGLKQAPKLWYDSINQFFLSLDSTQSTADPNLPYLSRRTIRRALTICFQAGQQQVKRDLSEQRQTSWWLGQLEFRPVEFLQRPRFPEDHRPLFDFGGLVCFEAARLRNKLDAQHSFWKS